MAEKEPFLTDQSQTMTAGVRIVMMKKRRKMTVTDTNPDHTPSSPLLCLGHLYLYTTLHPREVSTANKVISVLLRGREVI